jgi:mRNA interferase MazF
MIAEKLVFGDILLLKFPYTDGYSFKKRPVLLINDLEDGDIIVCRITSKIYHSKYDIVIENWVNSGLKLASIIRVHKLATLEKDMVVSVMGKINDILRLEVCKIFTSIAT